MTSILSCQEIIENLTAAIVVLDSQLRVNRLNSAAEILFGISQRQANLIPIQSLLVANSDLLTSLQRVKKTGQNLIERELTLFLPNSGELLVDCAIKVVDVNDEQSYILLELSQLDSQQRLSRDDSLNAQQQVLKGLAHEIKNPLGGLRGAAQLLERQLHSDELKEYTEIIISEADRLQNLLSKMLGSQQRTEHAWVNIHQILQRVRQLVAVDLDPRLQLIADYDPSIPELRVDLDQMVQIFLNIMLNAVQALNGVGHIILRTRIQRNITIEQHYYRLAVCIQVEDNGPGIDKELQDRMFFPLVTSRAEGTGLGLYIVQDLVHRNKGMISCNSQTGRTIFSVIFPLESSSD